MKERLIQLLERERISSAEFADRIGVQRSNVSHILNGRNNPGFSFIQKVLETFPKVNSRWLITGEGNMESLALASPKAAENDLFSANQAPNKESVVHKSKEPEQQKEKRIENEQYQSIEPKFIPDQTKRNVIRVMLFYDDFTFDDFSPTDKM
jgi:transcriptional regulator with XRE-family HTH domain